MQPGAKSTKPQLRTTAIELEKSVSLKHYIIYNCSLFIKDVFSITSCNQCANICRQPEDVIRDESHESQVNAATGANMADSYGSIAHNLQNYT